jgi:hypothetical protein
MDKQNMHVWASEHLHNIMETPLHPESAQHGVFCQVVLMSMTA